MKIRLSVGDVNIDVRGITDKAENDPEFWKFAASEWHRLYKDWVPMESSALYMQIQVRPKEIEHTAPYAHYQYEGQAYGPNYPIAEGERVVGYFSQPNRLKKATGKLLKYNKQYHPHATSKWDKAAAPTQLPNLAAEMQNYVDQGRLKLE